MADIKLTLVVACALVDPDKRILLAQRPEGKTLAGLWEFPGGKVEPGESPVRDAEFGLVHEQELIFVESPTKVGNQFQSRHGEGVHLGGKMDMAALFT